MTQWHQEDWISAYLDDELSPEERQQAEDRIGRDSALQAHIAQMKHLGERMRSLPTHRLPASFAAQVRQMAESTRETNKLHPHVALPAHTAPTANHWRTSKYVALGVVGTLAATLLASLTLPQMMLERSATESAVAMTPGDLDDNFGQPLDETLDESDLMEVASDLGLERGGSNLLADESPLESAGSAPSPASAARPYASDPVPSDFERPYGGAATPSAPGGFGSADNSGNAAAASMAQNRAGRSAQIRPTPTRTGQTPQEPQSAAAEAGFGAEGPDRGRAALENKAVSSSPASLLALLRERERIDLDGRGTEPSDVVATIRLRPSQSMKQLDDALTRNRFVYIAGKSVVDHNVSAADKVQAVESETQSDGDADAVNDAVDRPEVASGEFSPAGPLSDAPPGGRGLGGGGFGGAAAGENPGPVMPIMKLESSLPAEVLLGIQQDAQPVMLEVEGTVEQVEGLLSDLSESSSITFYRYSVTEDEQLNEAQDTKRDSKIELDATTEGEDGTVGPGATQRFQVAGAGVAGRAGLERRDDQPELDDSVERAPSTEPSAADPPSPTSGGEFGNGVSGKSGAAVANVLAEGGSNASADFGFVRLTAPQEMFAQMLLQQPQDLEGQDDARFAEEGQGETTDAATRRSDPLSVAQAGDESDAAPNLAESNGGAGERIRGSARDPFQSQANRKEVLAAQGAGSRRGRLRLYLLLVPDATPQPSPPVGGESPK